MMNNRTFGVEIEIANRTMREMTIMLRTAGFNVYCDDDGSLNNGPVMFDPNEQYVRDRPEYTKAWKVVYDGSVSNGCEVVSPVLSGHSGLEQVKSVLKAMNKDGAKANRHCGLHVHVGAGDLSVMELQHVARRYGTFEPVIDNFIHVSRRADNGGYCNSMAPVIKALENASYNEDKREFLRQLGGRYHKVNLQAYLKHGTIEFRQLEGTTSWTKVCNWIEFCVCFVEASRLSTNVVQEYSRRAVAESKKISHPLRLLAKRTSVDIYDLARILGLGSRPEIRDWIKQINTKYPGFLTPFPGYSEYWEVRVPENVNLKVEIAYPEVSGTWDRGIPTSVVAHLHGIASKHAATATATC